MRREVHVPNITKLVGSIFSKPTSRTETREFDKIHTTG
jgi:hypothetical protein